ncbi:SRPBCC domain-containing protein [Micromonospora sp. LOL_024]|uniref:SRPBCC domain-containing protein n=1 Tax=Micromonospora sp. LOL_024 TaxID=3345412 RepID=UPI003A855989
MTRAELRGDELIAERDLSAAPDRVWAAFTSPASIAAFWGGSHATVPPNSVTVDLRPGGEFALDTHAPSGARRRLRFVYVSIAAPHELVFDEPATGLRTTVTVHPVGDGTHLTVHQRQLPAELQTSQAGFRTGDHPRILTTLTDDVEWVIHGHRSTRGKVEFDGEIENPAFTGSPELHVERVYEDGAAVVTMGEGRGVRVDGGPVHFAFNDLFTFPTG